MDDRPAMERRIALLADIHGNCLALDAVLEDIERRGGADEFWILGDLAALGPEPVAVLERLHALPEAVFIRGNADRYVTTEDKPPPSIVEAQANPAFIPTVAEIAATFAWTQGAVTAAGWLPFLETLPLHYRRMLPNGTRVLAVHASPERDDDAGIAPDMPDDVLAQLLNGCEAELVLAGHTHWALNRRVANVHVVNPGSISNSVMPGLYASYALLQANLFGYQVQHYRVAYDRDAVIQHLDAIRHPGRAFIKRLLQGGLVREQWGEPDVYEA